MKQHDLGGRHLLPPSTPPSPDPQTSRQWSNDPDSSSRWSCLGSTTATQHWPACRRQRSHHCSECRTQRLAWCSNLGRRSMLFYAFCSCTGFRSAGEYSSSCAVSCTRSFVATWRIPFVLSVPAAIQFRSPVGTFHQLLTASSTDQIQRVAFSHAGRSAWNALPEDSRATSDSVVFRRLLKTHYFSLAFNVFQFFVLLTHGMHLRSWYSKRTTNNCDDDDDGSSSSICVPSLTFVDLSVRKILCIYCVSINRSDDFDLWLYDLKLGALLHIGWATSLPILVFLVHLRSQSHPVNLDHWPLTLKRAHYPINFGVSRTFRFRPISQHMSDASCDLATLTLDLGCNGACRWYESSYSFCVPRLTFVGLSFRTIWCNFGLSISWPGDFDHWPLILNLMRIITRGVGNLPTNFGVYRYFGVSFSTYQPTPVRCTK